MNALDIQIKRSRIITTIIVVIFVIVIVGTAEAVSKRKLTRTDKNGPVTITAVYLNPIEKNTGTLIRFEVKLDTHSVDLDQYKLEDLTTIRFDNGTEQQSSGLNVEGSGHHIVNILSFPGPVPETAKDLTLIIRNVGDVAERQLEWKLPIQ